MKSLFRPLAICVCSILAGCSQALAEPNPFKLPRTDDELQALQKFAHQTIPEDQWSPLCPAPLKEIEAKITLIGFAKGWDQNTLDSIRAQEAERLYSTQTKYAPKPIVDDTDLKTDTARGEAIRKLETYDQFWASAIGRYSELREAVPEKNSPVFGILYNRGNCQEQAYVLETLKPILESSDFPTDERFGDGTMRSLMMITQHADEDVAFQAKMLKEFQSRPDSLPEQTLALLTDRVKINQGQPQTYGTQVQCKNGKYKPKPTVDPENLDKRRASVGLEPFADYVKKIPGCGNNVTF